MKRFSAAYNWVRMFALIFKHKKWISACLILLSFAYGILPTVSAYLMSLFLDHFLKGIWYALPYFIIWVFLMLSAELLVYLKGVLSLRVQYEIEEEYKTLIMEKMLNIDLRYRENGEYADIIARAQNAINPINIMNLINNVPMLISQVIGMISILILFGGISWVLPILCCAFFMLCILLQKHSSKAYFDFLRKNSQEDRLLNAYENIIIDTYTLKELRIYNVIDWAVDKWKITYNKVYRIKERKILRKSIASNLSDFFMQDLLPVILIMAILFSAHFSLSSVITVTQLSFTLSGKLFFVMYQMSAFHEIDQLLKDFFAFLDLDVVKIRGKGESAEHISICLENVAFKYDKELVLKNINLKIHHGEKIAIVGANGSGKTTLVKILLGLYNPSAGKIEFKSSNQVESYRTSVMFQDYVKYYLTMRENIGFGDLDEMNNDALLKKIMKETNIDYLLDRIQLDDQIGMVYEGTEFSGGEWQKIAFARAIVNKEVSLLVLDEPTSSIDSLTESQIMHRLANLTGNTVIIISHKLSSVQLVDKIIVMKDGEIIESGTHEELMQNKAAYYQMYLSQVEMYS